MSCSECGAPLVSGMICWEQLEAIGAWEFQDPVLMAEHFLTVASYNLQHPASFTDEAIAGLRSAFRQHLDQGVAVSHIRHQNAKAYNGNRRVRKPEAERIPSLRTWPLTIADVYFPDQPEGAAARVRAWAAAIRQQLD